MVNHTYLITISGVVHTERVNVKTPENTHDKMASLCSKLKLRYIANGNINVNYLPKDRLHLAESGKTILANDLISNMNNFLSSTN